LRALLPVPQKRKSLVAFGSIMLLALAITSSLLMTYNGSAYASTNTDPFSCTYSGKPCTQATDTSGNFVVGATYPGPGVSSLSVTLRSYTVAAGDGKRYMIYRMNVTLTPDPSARRVNYPYTLVPGTPQYDTSAGGNDSAIVARLWSLNRQGCAGEPCTQQNFNDLEPQSACVQTGSSTINASVPIQGASISWSDNIPTFASCTFAPGSDQWSQYYNYTLVDRSLLLSKISTEFVFSQWEVGTAPSFDIGYSVQSHFMDPASKVEVDGPSTGNLAVHFINPIV
jgi:hypothetical protein